MPRHGLTSKPSSGPMAEAGRHPSTRCIFLSAAVNVIGRAYGSAQLGEQALKKGLRDERVRWRCQLLNGDGARWSLPTSELARSGRFWRYVNIGEVHWSENWACINLHGGPTIGMIEVA